MGITFNQVVLKPLLFMVPGFAALPQELTGFALILLTVSMMNAWAMPAGFKFAGKYFLPPQGFITTCVKLICVFSMLGVLAAAQNEDARSMTLTLFVPDSE